MHGHIDIGDAVNRDAPLNRGLVSWYLALPDQQRGVMFRDLTMRSHGTLTNGPTWRGATGRPGGFGAVTLDGSDDYVGLTLGTGIGTTLDMYFTAWVYPRSFGAYDFIAGCRPIGLGFFLSGGSGNPFTMEWIGNAFEYDGATGLTLSTNAWNFVAASSDATLNYMYRWNAASGWASYSLNPGAKGAKNFDNSSWRIGGDSNNPSTGSFDGLVDDVRFGSIYATESHLFQIFQASRLGYQNELNWLSRPVTATEQGVAATPFKYVIGAGCGGHIISSGI